MKCRWLVAFLIASCFYRTPAFLNFFPLLYADTTPLQEVDRISSQLEHLRQELSSRFGIREIFVGGGSAISLLDYVYFSKNVKMRDLDVFVILGKEVTPEFSKEIGLALESDILGKFSEADLRPRPRGNPNLPAPLSYEYNAGYGFFWLSGENIVDLSIFHDAQALNTNGIMTQDRVRIRLDGSTSLKEAIEMLRQSGLKGRKTNPSLVDPQDGYEDWIQKTPKISNTTELEREPALGSLRVLRSHRKLGIMPSEATIAQLRELIQNNRSEPHRLQMVRNVLKMLKDSDAALQLSFLARISAFKKWNPGLNDFLAKKSEDEIKNLIETGFANTNKISNRSSFAFLEIANQLEAGHKERLLADFSLVDKTALRSEKFPAKIPGIFLRPCADLNIELQPIGAY